MPEGSPYAERVADDDDPLRFLLRAARAWRVPPTVVLKDRTVNTTEWTSRDVDLLLALEAYEARLCSGCGGDRVATTDPANQFRYKGRIAAVCHRCVALEVASDVKHPHPGALSFTAELSALESEEAAG